MSIPILEFKSNTFFYNQLFMKWLQIRCTVVLYGKSALNSMMETNVLLIGSIDLNLNGCGTQTITTRRFLPTFIVCALLMIILGKLVGINWVPLMKNIQLLVQVTRSSVTVIINFLLIVIPMRHAYIYTCVEYSTNVKLIYKIRIFFVYGLQR